VIAAPDFCHGLDTFDMHNNLSWMPSVSNVPVLQALTSRNIGQGSGARGGDGNSNPSARGTPATTASASPAPAAPAANRRDPGRPVQNTDRDTMFTGNTTFAANVRTHRVQQAISLAAPLLNTCGTECHNACASLGTQKASVSRTATEWRITCQ
jgi:hypothetical protein